MCYLMTVRGASLKSAVLLHGMGVCAFPAAGVPERGWVCAAARGLQQPADPICLPQRWDAELKKQSQASDAPAQLPFLCRVIARSHQLLGTALFSTAESRSWCQAPAYGCQKICSWVVSFSLLDG